MKGTTAFKNTIKSYLDKMATEDPFFEIRYQDTTKNIDDCITYILNTVKNSGSNGFEDDEIYNMAMHYYDEPDIKPGSSLKMKVVVNHAVELTEEEIAEAKQKAIDDVISEQRKKMLGTKKPKKEEPTTPTLEHPEDNTPTLF